MPTANYIPDADECVLLEGFVCEFLEPDWSGFMTLDELYTCYKFWRLIMHFDVSEALTKKELLSVVTCVGHTSWAKISRGTIIVLGYRVPSKFAKLCRPKRPRDEDMDF